MNSLKDISEYLSGCKKVVICGHTMPDGDSVGSVLATGLFLSALGVECTLATADQVPSMYGFLPGIDRFKTADQLEEGYDTAVILDCTDLGRIGDSLADLISRTPNKVNIDHHVSNQEFGTLNYVDPGAAATGEIVYHLIKCMDSDLTRDIAVNLYTAIVMDTGSFRFDNTTDKTHEIAAELVRTGLDVGEINKDLFEKKDAVQLKLLGYALKELKTSADGKIAWVTVPIDIMKEMQAQDEHADGIINYPRMLYGVEVALLLREISPGKFKVGFRSRRNVDVNQIAAAFGGGGHPRAAGCLIEGSRDEVEKRIIDLCAESLASINQ